MEDEVIIDLADLVDDQKVDWEIRFQKFFFIFTSFLFFFFAIPIIIAFLIKSPNLNEDMIILGISYQKILIIFLLTAILIAYISAFFLKISTIPILLIFILCLFCSFPLIVSLKNNFTLQQAITDIPFFENWPFFLKPSYILIEFLIPISIIICLLLQTKAFLSKNRNTYAFFFAAAYLSVAAFVGFFTLIKSNEPNIASTLIEWVKKENRYPINPQRPIENHIPDTNLEIQILSNKIDKILEVLAQKEVKNEVKDVTHDKPVVLDINSKVQILSEKVDKMEELNVKVQNLSDKIDHIMELLPKIKEEACQTKTK
ncbi:MAG: hypothetical protein HQK78_05530 [Desulfobacterales bacterium]|nr:hypothetical protein [Desulfobacterales bacterium]